MNNDESYIVLARKYRPKKLSDLIGQEEVAEIIESSPIMLKSFFDISNFL